MTQRQYQLFPNTDIFCSLENTAQEVVLLQSFPISQPSATLCHFFDIEPKKTYISTLDYIHLLFLQNRLIVRPFAFAGELAWPWLLDWRGVVWNCEGEWNCHKHNLQINEKGNVESIVVVVV